MSGNQFGFGRWSSGNSNYGSSNRSNPRDSRSHPYRRQEDLDSELRGEERRRLQSRTKFDNHEYERSSGRDRQYQNNDNTQDDRQYQDNDYGRRSYVSQRGRHYPDNFHDRNIRSNSSQRDRQYEDIDFNQMDIPRQQGMEYNQRDEQCQNMDYGFDDRNNRSNSRQRDRQYEDMDYNRMDIPRQQDMHYNQRDRSRQDMNYNQRDRSRQDVDYNQRDRPRQDVDYNQRDRSRQDVDYNQRDKFLQDVDYNQGGRSRKDVDYNQRDRSHQDVDYNQRDRFRQDVDYNQRDRSRKDMDYNPRDKQYQNVEPRRYAQRNTEDTGRWFNSESNSGFKETCKNGSHTNVSERGNSSKLRKGDCNPSSSKTNISNNANQNKGSITPKEIPKVEPKDVPKVEPKDIPKVEPMANQTVPQCQSSTGIPAESSIEPSIKDDVKNDAENKVGSDFVADGGNCKWKVTAISNNNIKIILNQFLDENSKMILIFLNHALYEGYSKGNIVHCNLISNYYLGHRNAVKLFRYEVRKLVDEKYKPDSASPEELAQRKRNNLNRSRQVVFESMISAVGDVTEEQKVMREKLVDDCIEILLAPVYAEELLPTPEDYVEDPSVKRTEAELRKEVQWQFVILAYKQLGFEIDETQGSVENLLKFHLENGILAAVLVECIRTYGAKGKKEKPGDNVVLTGQLAKSLKHAPSLGILRNQTSSQIYAQQVANKMQFQTEIMDLLPPGEELSTDLILNFANMILYFDQAMTVVQHNLMVYTPFVPLPLDIKLELFNAMVKNVYKEALNVWKRGVPLQARKFNWLPN